MPAGKNVVEIPLPEVGLPDVPPEALAPYLDAATACMTRHGVRRTTVADMAKELDVSPMTVYRHVGSLDRVIRLLFARELHRLLEAAPTFFEGADGADAVVNLSNGLVDWVRNHPIFGKVLTDEPDVVGEILVGSLAGPALELAASVVAGLLDGAMDEGILRRDDSRVLASWLVRLLLTVIVIPPPGDIETFLVGIVRPVLDRAGASTKLVRKAAHKGPRPS
ncbi:MAG: TetR/AcrR family transcriptional regulator [Acidimicrobiales bacterium]